MTVAGSDFLLRFCLWSGPHRPANVDALTAIVASGAERAATVGANIVGAMLLDCCVGAYFIVFVNRRRDFRAATADIAMAISAAEPMCQRYSITLRTQQIRSRATVVNRFEMTVGGADRRVVDVVRFNGPCSRIEADGIISVHEARLLSELARNQ